MPAKHKGFNLSPRLKSAGSSGVREGSSGSGKPSRSGGLAGWTGFGPRFRSQPFPPTARTRPSRPTAHDPLCSTDMRPADDWEGCVD
jgi:hypothetical protein